MELGALALKNWKWIAMGLMALTIAVLGNRLIASYKDNGVVTTQLKSSNAAIGVLKTQLGDRDKKLAEQANREAIDFGQCQADAASSDSAAFRKGVNVGKIIGKKEQCDKLLSPPPAWPSSAGVVPKAH